jgi:DNA-binding CsgD family transcriptional regulator
MSLLRELEAMGATLDDLLDDLGASLTLLDPEGRIVWQNEASIARVGEQRGANFLDLLVPEQRRAAATDFMRLRFTPGATSRREVVVTADGRRMRSLSVSVSVRSGKEAAGVLALGVPLNSDDGPPIHVELPPRQLETLELLATGRSTTEVARALGVTRETARNYIRRLLRNLGVHSRLEAVAHGRRLGLIRDDPSGSSRE